MNYDIHTCLYQIGRLEGTKTLDEVKAEVDAFLATNNIEVYEVAICKGRLLCKKYRNSFDVNWADIEWK